MQVVKILLFPLVEYKTNLATMAESDLKKARLDYDCKSKDQNKTVELDCTVWGHYRDYLDSCEDNEDAGDLDELEEIVELLKDEQPKSVEVKEGIFIRPLPFRSVLLSVCHTILGEYEMGDYLAECKGPSLSTSTSDDDTARRKKRMLHHMAKALEFCPLNAQAWSLSANMARLQLQDFLNNEVHARQMKLASVIAAYQKAAEAALEIRASSIHALDGEGEDGEDVGDTETQVGLIEKEWIELLLLNQMSGVEWTCHSEEESCTEEVEDEEPQENDDEGTRWFWSSSAVEGTCRFMSSMLLSIVGNHNIARRHLARLGVSHRLHPKIWSHSAEKTKPLLPCDQAQLKNNIPAVATGGVLPHKLYQRLCQVFSPESPYWKESEYSQRGYYSFFMVCPNSNHREKDFIGNLMEDVIFNFLLPLAEKKLKACRSDAPIVGAEWWVHTRPLSSNLGHQLHFDTDEDLLSQDQQEISHPILSSVLYLTGSAQGAGSTVVLDQTPNSSEVATKAWICKPTDNSFLLFPGDRLHGVLPCSGSFKLLDTPVQTDVRVEDLLGPRESTNADVPHRLTLMVGFWTRHVPDRMKHRRLYGPCGPMPPASDEHSWVKDIENEYKPCGVSISSIESPTTFASVPVVEPVWEKLNVMARDASDPDLIVPRPIDHRFFVHNAPRCFYESLLERNKTDHPDIDNDKE